MTLLTLIMAFLINRLRSLLLSPDSPLELRLRTLYHKILSTKWYFRGQNSLAQRSYKKYRAQQLQKDSLDDQILIEDQPAVTFIISEHDESQTNLILTINSIRELVGENWEIIILSPNYAELSQLNIKPDSRISLTQTDYEDLLDSINGEYVLFCESGDQFYKTLLLNFYASFSEESYADVTYLDCEIIEEAKGNPQPFFKPSTCSPALLLSVNYLSRSFLRVNALHQIWADIDFSTSLLGLELEAILRLYENEFTFRHIPNLLLTQIRKVTPAIPEIQSVLVNHLKRQGLHAVTATNPGIGTRFLWETGSPSLAIIILSKNNYPFLKTLVPALDEIPYRGELSIHIVDNGSEDPATLRYYQEIQKNHKIAIIPYPKAFNYSEAINLGAAKSYSDLILFMNDDMELINPYWLDELTQWAIRPEIGVVGAKLLRKNRTIQHAGIILGLTGFVGHIYLNAPEHYYGLLGSVNWYRNYLALTGACQMVRREIFNEVGGYDEDYQLAFGDIDFCLKVYQKGYQNVYTPFAQLYHFEGSSRGYQTPAGDALKGYEEFGSYLLEEDPFFNPNLTYTRIPKCMLRKRTEDERRTQIEARKNFYQKK